MIRVVRAAGPDGLAPVRVAGTGLARRRLSLRGRAVRRPPGGSGGCRAGLGPRSGLRVRDWARGTGISNLKLGRAGCNGVLTPRGKFNQLCCVKEMTCPLSPGIRIKSAMMKLFDSVFVIHYDRVSFRLIHLVALAKSLNPCTRKW